MRSFRPKCTFYIKEKYKTKEDFSDAFLTVRDFPLSHQVIENCPVTGIQVRTDDLGVKKVKAVETPHGTIETPCVVNCAGETEAHLSKIILNKAASPNQTRTTVALLICVCKS